MKKKFNGKQIASMIFGGGVWWAVSNAFHSSTKTINWGAFYIVVVIAIMYYIISSK